MNQRTSDILTRRWTALPNDEIGGWAVTTDGRSPADGGVMAADMVWSQEIAEHIAELHNRFLDGVDLDVYADNQRLRTELVATQANRDEIAATLNAIWETLGLSGDDHPVRAVKRLQHAERRANRHAIERDKDVAEANAVVAARDAEIARFNAREAALRLELHDARAQRDAAQRERDTSREVSRSNRRHCTDCRCIHEPCGYVIGSPGCASHCGEDVAPERPATSPQEPDGCPVPQWDGPYQFPCGLGASIGVCPKHGRFRDDILADANVQAEPNGVATLAGVPIPLDGGPVPGFAEVKASSDLDVPRVRLP